MDTAPLMGPQATDGVHHAADQGAPSHPLMEISPTPTDEEAAAIAAAIEVAWPRVAAVAVEPPESPRWRFAGRWWSKPIPSRRDRP